MKIILIVVSLLMVFSVHATKRSLSFDFNVKSSGADFYACNAGLKHSPNKVVYYPGENTTISAGESKANVPFAEMTPKQKGEASCDMLGGADYAAEKLNPQLATDPADFDGLVYHIEVLYRGKPGLHPEVTWFNQVAYACSGYLTMYHPAFQIWRTKENSAEIEALYKDKPDYWANWAYANLEGVDRLYDVAQVTVEGVTCGDESNCSLVMANNTDDYMVAKKQTWVGNDPDAVPTALTETIVAGDSSFAQAHNEGWGTQILKEVDFFLGSDLFGAEYYVDFCYRGSRIDYADFTTKFIATARAEIMTEGLTSYGDWSNLEGGIELSCKTKSSDAENIESNTDSSSFAGASYLEFDKSEDLTGDNIDNCVLRFTFKEAAKDALRPHELTDQKVYLDATIEENRTLN